MNYLIYKITNKLNNKFYVGKHKTANKDDGYLGSGILIDRAIKKHGRENFVKEILVECSSLEEMNQKEIDIVDAEFVARDDTYNVVVGGNGGNFTTEQRMLGAKNFVDRLNSDEEFRKEMIEKRRIAATIRNLKYGSPVGWPGAKFSDETKKKMSVSGKGKRRGAANGVFGKHWVTDGTISKMVDKSIIPDGWRKGHVNNK